MSDRKMELDRPQPPPPMMSTGTSTLRIGHSLLLVSLKAETSPRQVLPAPRPGCRCRRKIASAMFLRDWRNSQSLRRPRGARATASPNRLRSTEFGLLLLAPLLALDA